MLDAFLVQLELVDFLDLGLEKGGFLGGEAGFAADAVNFRQLGPPFPVRVPIGGEGVPAAGIEVDEGQLLRFVKEFLGFAGAVEINPELSDFAQLGLGGHAAVDEDAGGLVAGNDPTEKELALLAGFDAKAFKEGIEGGGVVEGKGGLEDAGGAALADERLVGAGPGEEGERSEENGFAGPGLNRFTASIMIDLPAPVSPVTAV